MKKVIDNRKRWRWNIFAVIVFFLASFAVLQYDNLQSYSLGIAFIIAALYGIIAIYKGKKFIF